MNTRRNFLKSSAAFLALGTSGALTSGIQASETSAEVQQIAADTGFSSNESRISLNTATIIHYNLPILDQIRLARKAGFRNMEIWFRDIERFLAEGGKLSDLRLLLDDLGMKIVGGINFFAWGHPEEERRKKALEEMRRGMEQMQVLGCTHFAAAPAGIHSRKDISLPELAERYRAILELGDQFGVYPQLEIWGSGSTLFKLSDALWIAAEAAHPQASLLLDVYHLYRGGNDFASLLQVSGAQMTNFHWNDWPAGIEREKLQDSDRVFPGDGVAPLKFIHETLRKTGYSGFFSIEIFNKKYCGENSPEEMLRLSYEKMKKAVQPEWL